MTNEDVQAVLRRVASWPKARQDDAAKVLLAMEAEGTAPYALSEDEHADLLRALAEVADGEYASDAEVEAVFARHRE